MRNRAVPLRPLGRAAVSRMVVAPPPSQALAPHGALARSVLPRAVPPPTSARSLALQRLYAEHRPLLEHEQLPARPTGLMSGGIIVLDAEEAFLPARSIWRRRARSVDADTFASILDRLSALQVSSPRAARMSRRTSRSTGFAPASPAVYAASQRIERMEREADAREEAITNAMERGDDVEQAERLCAEADLVVLGEPNGIPREWPRGVATHLGMHTQPYVPPSVQTTSSRRSLRRVDDEASDEDTHLWLSHALVQNRVGAARAWSAIEPSVAPVMLDSVRRKRRKKMNKHKYKKLRKRQRAERQRLKK